MKYKILSNGKSFRVKIKTFLFWHSIKSYCVTHCFECPILSYTKSFESEYLAEKYIKKEYGSSATRIREHRVL